MKLNFFLLSLKQALNLKPQTLDHLARLNIYTIKDLLFHIPSNFIKKYVNPNLSMVQNGQNIIADVVVEHLETPKKLRSKAPTKVICSNDSGTIILTYFHKIPSFIFHKLCVGNKIKISGIAHKFNYNLTINHPDILNHSNVNLLSAIYHLTYGVTSSQLSNYVDRLILQMNNFKINEWIACDILEKENLPDFKTAIHNLHQPESLKEQSRAIKRLKYDELLANQIAMIRFKKITKSEKLNAYSPDLILQKEIVGSLGFELTEDQIRALKEIERDQNSNFRMSRLLQGDVGSGKTLVALLSMINAISSDLQAVLMAPTDILSSQHYNCFLKALEDTNIVIAILTGKTKVSEKKQILEDLALGKIDILIGTHAVFQENVIFHNLGYVVIDEQHRFGVNQRLELLNKGKEADLLIMTATPIPRSLCLTMFGDMESSKIYSKPKNRIPTITSIMSSEKLGSLIEQVTEKVNCGERLYWICPLVKYEKDDDLESEEQHLMDAESRYKILSEIFGDKVGIVHGKMKATEKDEAMQKFKQGKILVLVATTVIEVGIDVPEANLMIIENSERFGLSTLHQLRGRVGRGSEQSYCFLIYKFPLTNIAKERLKIMRESNDGFKISEKDLELRGGGEILGTKQSGEEGFKFADLSTDQKLLYLAHNEAKKLLEKNESMDIIDSLVEIFSYDQNNKA